ncbi:MAG: hypothetical protein ACE14P_06215 [Methanotrichaceae archaeon]
MILDILKVSADFTVWVAVPKRTVRDEDESPIFAKELLANWMFWI